jgi:hypothetical protein
MTNTQSMSSPLLIKSVSMTGGASRMWIRLRECSGTSPAGLKRFVAGSPSDEYVTWHWSYQSISGTRKAGWIYPNHFLGEGRIRLLPEPAVVYA